MSTKVILRDENWYYVYDAQWSDTTSILLKPKYPNLTSLRYFPDEIVETLEKSNIHEFLRERETLPGLYGCRVVDSVEFSNEKDALAFILKYGDYIKHRN